MEDKLDIFIFTHKTPKFIPSNKCYKMVALECDKDKVNCNLEKIVCDSSKDNIFNFERAYSEGSRIYYLWKNYPLKEYVGTAHYRRFFDFIDNIPNLDNLFKTYDAILPKFDLWTTVKNQYTLNHNLKDLNKIIEIINEYYPEYSDAAKTFIDGDNFIPCNIFIMKKEMFNEYCEFVFGVLDKYNAIMGFENDLDVFNWVINHFEDYTSNRVGMLYSIPYQARIQSFLLERISNIFYNKKIKNPYMVELVLTEINFDEEKTIFKNI